MNKHEYISALNSALVSAGAVGIPDILRDYEAYFDRKAADGYSDDDAAAKLEEPAVIAKQFSPQRQPRSRGPSALVFLGLIIASIFALCFFVFLYSWTILLSAFAAANVIFGICLLLGANIYGVIPYIPTIESMLFGIALMALAVLSVIAVIYCYLYAAHLLRIYCRWVKNKYTRFYTPPLPKHPTLSAKTIRKLRDTALFSATVFASFFAGAIIILCLNTQSLTFWKVLGWF